MVIILNIQNPSLKTGSTYLNLVIICITVGIIMFLLTKYYLDSKK
jgi:hypothetical protein